VADGAAAHAGREAWRGHAMKLLCFSNRISSLTDKEIPMIGELDMVVLTRDLSEHGLQKADQHLSQSY
jgi:hypothetical protein